MRIEIACKVGESILHACQREKIFSDSVCGGKGICGKCKVRMMTNVVEPSDADKAFFKEEELSQGWRLACLAKPAGVCTIEIPFGNQGELSVVTDSLSVYNLKKNKDNKNKDNKNKNDINKNDINENDINENDINIKDIKIEKKREHGRESDERAILVVDVGTTTVAIQLLRCSGKDGGGIEVVDTYTAVNRQRCYGADVISRIQAANEGMGPELKRGICTTIGEGMEKLLGNVSVGQILIAGNTTMVHLLMGYSCETLGRAPFRPVTKEGLHEDASQLFKPYLSGETAACVKDARVYIFPGISAFVGGDIVAGMYDVDFHKKQEVQLLIDLGTNGEMVIGNRTRMLAASTAAGPAFEGGGLSCGCPGIKGAICGGSLSRDGTWKLETIGDEEPIGICGSGIVEILYELLTQGCMDDTGLLADGNLERIYLAGEKVYLTQKDIRQFQMAKAAIRAGVETLMGEYGVLGEEISGIYIAGGFGYYLNLQKALAIGLFPDSFQGKMTAIGNSCLAGLKRFAVEQDEGRLLNITKYTADCSLAENKYFQERYMECMYFPKNSE